MKNILNVSNNHEHNLKAVAYIRQTTEDSDSALCHQRQRIRDYAFQKGITIVTEYIDRTHAIPYIERDGLCQLVEDAQGVPCWNKVLIQDASRLSRKIDEVEKLILLLQDHGIEVVFVKESHCPVDTDEVLTMIQAYYCNIAR